jgi:hypothetical protein
MFTPINNSRGTLDSDLPPTKFLEAKAAYALAATYPNVGPHSRSDLPQRMLGIISDIVHLHESPEKLARRLSSAATTAPERGVWNLWQEMLKELALSPALDNFSLIGLDAVPPVRRWYVSHATFVQDLLSRCPRLRRMAVALKWLEDTFEVPDLANRVVPYNPEVPNCQIDPDLQRKIFLQLRAGRWEQACVLAEDGSAFVSHIVSAAQMVAATQTNNTNSVDAKWRSNMPRATLFGEYETQASGKPRVRPTRNPHRLPLMLRMFEHLQTSSSSNKNNNENINQQHQAFFFDGIAGLICGDEAAMKSACRAHFGSTPAAAQRNLRNNTSRANQSLVNNFSSWQDELWATLRSHLVAAFTIAIVRGASDSVTSNIVEQFEGVFSKQAIERFISVMEARCGLSGHAVSPDDAASTTSADPSSNWFAVVDAHITESIQTRLKLLSSNFEPDSVDGVALQTLTLFLTDLEKGNSASILAGITAKIAPLRQEDVFNNHNNNNNNNADHHQHNNMMSPVASADGMKFQRTTSSSGGVGGGFPLPATSSSNNNNNNQKTSSSNMISSPIVAAGARHQLPPGHYLRWCLPEQAALCCLICLAAQRQLLPGGSVASPQSLAIYPELISTLINACLTDPHLEVTDFIHNLQTIAMFSSISQGADPKARAITHAAVLRCVRIRFVGDKGNFISNETNSAEGHMSALLREADAQFYNGDVQAVDLALRTVSAKLRDDKAVPMIMHDPRCEALVWKSFMSPQHLSHVLIEAVTTLKALWSENRNLRAMQDVVDVWGRRLQDLANGNNSASAIFGTGAVAAANNTTTATAPPLNPDVVKSISGQIQFWSAVLKCHDAARHVGERVAQLSSSTSSAMPNSKRHDLCVSSVFYIDELSNKFFPETIKLCPTYGATAVCACLEILAEATRSLIPFVDRITMTRLFQQAFQKVVAIEACEFLGLADSDSRSGVDLLPQQNASSLMQTLQALRTVYVAELQRRSSEEQIRNYAEKERKLMERR